MKSGELKKVDQGPENLPDLLVKMADGLAELFDLKLTLLRVELKEEVVAYLRGSVMILIGGIVAAVGFALLNIAIAFLVSALFNSTSLSQPIRYAIGFLITAAAYLVGGVVLIIVNKNKLAEQNLIPKRSVAELKKDKEMLEEKL